MHGNKTLVIHKGEKPHDELAVHPVRDAAVAGNRLAEIFDLEGAFQAGSEESAKGSDEGGESGEHEDVELHGCDVDHLRQEPQVG